MTLLAHVWLIVSWKEKAMQVLGISIIIEHPAGHGYSS